MMKKALCMIFVFAIVVAVGFPVSALNNMQTRLSELSDEECIAFIKEKGVVIPQAYETEMDCVEFVRFVIGQVEENPDAIFTFGYKFLTDFANEIKAIVNDYYGTGKASTYAYVGSPQNILQDNTVIGTWKSEYESYNCYAYAIEYDTWIHPGQIEWMNDGNDYETYFYNPYANVYTLAGWVHDDLVSLGYTVYSPTTTMPNTDTSKHSNLICIRKDEDITRDFHLMVVKKDGGWYHKPGGTNPLKYKYSPDSSRIWTQEGYDGFLYFRDDDVTYDSAIYYIKYTTPHEWKYTYCGSGQHINTCTVCKETSGSPGKCINANGKCKVCGIPMGFTPITPSKFGTAVPEEA